ncbi:hypothetical protein ACFO5R_09300 [Halosolutus amylolyticus]|uniref:Uncharacterized protein n=1 Tax=Halosolutus amylolyticus TaxID=2932267 RepID=A0ABD5PNX5_9EURY|nr:hypothetical protein [Halosolutus amylolyticus]
MTYEFAVPELGTVVDDGLLVSYQVGWGDVVEDGALVAGDPMLADKASDEGAIAATSTLAETGHTHSTRTGQSRIHSRYGYRTDPETTILTGSETTISIAPFSVL